MITIAFDGYSSCGKSTMARQLAATIGYTFVDTGAMYRAVTLLALRNGLFSADGKVNEPQLRRCSTRLSSLRGAIRSRGRQRPSSTART